MKAIFIRHKLSSTELILKELWDARLIAVHYKDIPSTDPNDYNHGSPGYKTLKRLWDYCHEGALVGADYHQLYPARMLVGKILPGSEIKGRLFGPYWYKVVQLEKVQEVSFIDFPLLLIQPRQTTLTGWPSMERHLKAILGIDEISPDVQSLHPGQLELVCCEFLRSDHAPNSLKIDFPLMPPGRSLQDIDIIGENASGLVIAQVTHSTNGSVIAKKLEILRAYSRADTQLVFFAPQSQQPQDAALLKDIHYIAIEDVFDKLFSNPNSATHRMIQRMLKGQL